jgi:hypothetical protein
MSGPLPQKLLLYSVSRGTYKEGIRVYNQFDYLVHGPLNSFCGKGPDI